MKDKPALSFHVPSSPTLTGAPERVIAPGMRVAPLYRSTEIVRPFPGVNPEPTIVTPVGMFPATICVAPKVMAGVPKMVRLTVAALPDASVTTITRMPAGVVALTLKPKPADDNKLPSALVVTVTPDPSADAGLVAVFSHVVAVPFTVKVSSELAAKPAPVTVTFESGLTATSDPSLGMVVYVAVAAAPLAPTTLIVCAPAVEAVGIPYPVSISMAPFVLATVKPAAKSPPIVMVVESNFTVSASPALKPEPVIEIRTALLRGPDVGVPEVGEIWIAAAATLSVVVAVLTGRPAIESATVSTYDPGI